MTRNPHYVPYFAITTDDEVWVSVYFNCIRTSNGILREKNHLLLQIHWGVGYITLNIILNEIKIGFSWD